MKQGLLFILFFFQLFSQRAFCQQEKWLDFELYGNLQKKEFRTFKDSLSMVRHVKIRYQELYDLGYLNPGQSGSQFKGDTLTLKIATGPLFEWLELRPGNVDPIWLVKAGFDQRRFQKRPFGYGQVAKLFDSVLRESENNGFPFASIRLDSIQRKGEAFTAALNLDTGPYITFDTLKVTGSTKTKRVYLSRVMQIKPGDPFSQRKVNDGIRQIKNFPYLRWAGEPELSFQNEEATLYLPVNDRRINTLDGIIGFLPNEIEENRLLVTGQFDLALFNVGGKGRNYSVNWQRLSQYSQNLKVSAIEPMLLGSMIDLGVSFFLLKEDTTFLNRDFRVDFGYRFNSDNYIRFFTRRQAGDLLAVSGLEQIGSLPDFGDYRFNNYGIQHEVFKLDDILLPRRGLYSQLEFAVGNKTIIENTGLPPVIYEGVDLKTIQYYIQGLAEKHFYLNSNWGVFTRLAAGLMENDNLLGNDLYRLGGLKTVRGFNENFFFANNYIYFNIEPRFYFDTYSYFMIFADIGRLENRVQGIGKDFPVSAGLGFSLETNSGIFNFIYALGKSNTQEFALNLSKIHFGYTGRF